MSEAKHTPGPWAVREHWCDEGAFEVYPTRGGPPKHGQWGALAEVPEYGPDAAPEAEANARLIAAAPELLEALQRLIGTGLDEQTYRAIMSEPAHFVNVVIAKATGEGK